MTGPRLTVLTTARTIITTAQMKIAKVTAQHTTASRIPIETLSHSVTAQPMMLKISIVTIFFSAFVVFILNLHHTLK
jgi:hypothetical protein